MEENNNIAVPFALVPAQANQGALYDYTSRQGLATYNNNIKTLYSSDDAKFDVDAAGLQTFLALLRHRATSAAWDFLVPDTITDEGNLEGPFKNLLSQHGEISLEHLATFSRTYIAQQSRAAQDNMQIVQCILGSLTMPGFRKVNVWHSQWYIEGFPAALVLIKVIIREAYIDTNATTRILREKLSSLPEELSLQHGDITKLNASVMVTLDQLTARGETTNDLLANLFKGYLSAEDETFVKYITRKQEEYDEGTNYTHTQLMTLAADKYKTLVEKGLWMAPSRQDKKIVALETQLASLRKYQPKSSSGNGKTGKQGGQFKPGNSSKGKGGTPKSDKPKPDKPAWMFQRPTSIKAPKVMDGKEYYWCLHHKCFGRHKMNECRLRASKQEQQANEQKGKPSSNSQEAPSLRISSAVLMDE